MDEAAAEGASGALDAASVNDRPRYEHPCPLPYAQSLKAREVIEGGLTADNPGFVSIVAMVETVWVLDRTCGLGALEIAATVERLLQISLLWKTSKRSSSR
jgi:hypothetical protein